MQAVPTCPKKTAADPAASNSDTIVDPVVAVYPIHTDQRSPNPNYGPQSHFIRTQRDFVNNEIITYLGKIC